SHVRLSNEEVETLLPRAKTSSEDLARVVRCQRIVRNWIWRRRNSRMLKVIERFTSKEEKKNPLAQKGRARWKTLTNLVRSEMEYVSSLQNCVENYLNPLRANAEIPFKKRKKKKSLKNSLRSKSFSISDVEMIFGNLELVLEMGRVFLGELSERVYGVWRGN